VATAQLSDRIRPQARGAVFPQVHQPNEGFAARLTLLDVLEFGLFAQDSGRCRKLKQSMRFDVVHHVVAHFLQIVSGL
jgi:hypothetical protein